ncbi:hypothetical protein BMS3Bbin08_01303 [bacterium BMS3Bbin08]|nr:hypothetical protein BMS3Bbin08_01303 [bacterium BMS3Bbin08]
MPAYMAAVMVDFQNIIDLIYVYTFPRNFIGNTVVVFIEFYVVVRRYTNIIFNICKQKRI